MRLVSFFCDAINPLSSDLQYGVWEEGKFRGIVVDKKKVWIKRGILATSALITGVLAVLALLSYFVIPQLYIWGTFGFGVGAAAMCGATPMYLAGLFIGRVFTHDKRERTISTWKRMGLLQNPPSPDVSIIVH